MTPKHKDTAFTSIRIIGKKAQRMINKAKESIAHEEKKPKKALPKKKEQDIMVIRLSLKSVVQVTLTIMVIGLAALVMFKLRHKILLLLLAVFVATIIDPGVEKMQRWGIQRGIAILVQYLIAIVLILFLVLSLVPIIAIQIQEIAISVTRDLQPFLENPEVTLPFVPADSPVNAQFTQMAKTFLQNISLEQFATNLQQTGQNLSDIATESVRFAARIAGSVVNFVVSFVVVLVLAFFIQMEKEKIVKWIRGFLPQKYRHYADLKSEAIHTKIGQWMRGEAMLMLSIFALTLLALVILRMPYALTLAVLAGFCEFIPAIGPLFAAIPALLIAGTQKGLIWLPVVAATYYVIQWCENNLLVPLIMRRAVGLSPIAILFAMMVGISFPDTVHPILGVMLAVPTTTIIALFLEDWRENQDDE